MLCQLEVAGRDVVSAAEGADRSSLNAAPARARARPKCVRAAELVVVNRYELEARSPETPSLLRADAGRGRRGPDRGRAGGRPRRAAARSRRSTARPPATRSPRASSSRCSRSRDRARRRCAAPARPARSRASRAGAQPSLPTADGGRRDTARMSDADHPRLRSRPRRRDRAAARARQSPELELRGVTTVAGNQTLEKTTANAIRVLELAGRARRSRSPPGAARRSCASRDVAADVHGETGLDGPDLPPPQARRRRRSTRSTSSPSRCATARRRSSPTGPLTNVALLLALAPGRRGRSGSC